MSSLVKKLVPVHGGTDAGPEPRYDFSSNANPLGPCPSVLQAIRAADVSRYPDPSYTQLRETLASYHDTSPDQIVVGAGASELILRLIQHLDGPVQQLGPTFSEYSRGARITGRKLISVKTPTAFLRAQSRQPGIGFICWPNNPSGELCPLDFIADAAKAGPVVVDLAYASMCPLNEVAGIDTAATGAYRLYSPNKSYGLTGIRGAYVITPRVDRRLALQAPSWVIGREAEAMLAAAVHSRAALWLEQSIVQFVGWRVKLASSLALRGLMVRHSPATFLLVRVGNAARITERLRDQGIRVRDGTSFGLRQWIRLSAQPPAAQRALLVALDKLL